MHDLARLKVATTLPRLADVLGVKPHALSYTLYWLDASQKYTTFTIPKKSGGLRIITAPKSRLKLVQRKLAKLLGQIQADLEKSRTTRHCVISHGLKKEYSIITNAEIDLPLNFHPAAIRVWGFCTPSGAGGATGDRRSWSGLRSRSPVAVNVAA
jgi:hypothetical protein